MNAFSSPQPLLEMCVAQKRGEARGITAVCSAHPAILEAAMQQVAARTAGGQNGAVLLVEATSNQVNQQGGYTGMTPARFTSFLAEIAQAVGLPAGRILLGGDHLGPNPWRQEPAAAALTKAAEMVQAYVRAGFAKIHLDASMSCAGDGPLSAEQIASRAAALCVAAESARTASGHSPVYVIGTEVPTPGGSKASPDNSSESGPQVTTAEDALETIRVFQSAFHARGLDAAWERVIALVVQPGVEFGDAEIHDYQRSRAAGLARAIESVPGLIYEAHSTDYQTRQVLRELVEDHFAILKVGPGLTFAYREALFALASIEREQAGGSASYPLSRLVETAEQEMLAEPRDWREYYPGGPEAQAYARKYSLSDRIRYYWPRPALDQAVQRLLENLARQPAPLGLLSQYLPLEYQLVREGRIPNQPRDLIRAHIQRVLEDYNAACTPRT